MLNNLLGFIVMIGKSDESMIGACWLCCCWCCFYVIDDWSRIWCWLQEYAGFRTVIVLPVCWLDRQLVELVFFLNDLIIGKLFWFTFLFLLGSLISIENSDLWSHIRVWFSLGKSFLKRILDAVMNTSDHILSCSWCLLGVGPVICWFRCRY